MALEVCKVTRQSFLTKKIEFSLIKIWRQNTLHFDIQHNDTQQKGIIYEIQHTNIQHNDIQYNDIQHNYIQHNNTQHNNTLPLS